MRHASPEMSADRHRWMALAVVCLAQLMIVLDVTIVNVALPSIQRDLHFSQGNLTWVINAFLVSFGSLLLLAGRLGDLIGRRDIFLTGLAVFTAASALCGAAPDQAWLITARFLQGIGGALQASVILAIIVTEFTAPDERARAMSAYMFVSVAGGSLGLLAGGALTQALDWHWIFFVNLPIGVATFGLGRVLLDRDRGAGLRGGVDWLGSALITTSLMTAVFAIVRATSDGWGSTTVLGFGALAAALMVAFAAVESRAAHPILPARILRLPGLVAANLVRGLLVTGMYSTFFTGTLYLEHVRGYGALQTGLAFLPWTITVAILSRGTTAWLIRRFGERRVLVGGMAMVVVGLGLVHGVGSGTAFFPQLFLAFFCIGLGIGTAFMPLLTIAMAEVPAADAGLASGLTNVSQQIAGALGLAVLATLSANRTHGLAASGHTAVASLIGGYRLAFLAAALSVAAGLGLALILLRAPRQQADVVLADGGPEPAQFVPSGAGHPGSEFEREAA